MWADTLLILFISICTALLGEGVTWVLVYRTEKYQKLKSEIEKQSKKLEKKKEAHGEAANLDRSKKRKLEAVSNYFYYLPLQSQSQSQSWGGCQP